VDLLVVDVVLPGVHGFALARMARMKHHNIPCIYVTAHDLPTSEAVGPVYFLGRGGDVRNVDDLAITLADSCSIRDRHNQLRCVQSGIVAMSSMRLWHYAKQRGTSPSRFRRIEPNCCQRRCVACPT